MLTSCSFYKLTGEDSWTYKKAEKHVIGNLMIYCHLCGFTRWARMEPSPDVEEGVIGGRLVLTGVKETVVSFAADRAGWLRLGDEGGECLFSTVLH